MGMMKKLGEVGNVPSCVVLWCQVRRLLFAGGGQSVAGVVL